MPVVRIGKRYTFDAAHRLPLHEGKCARPHGHTYTLELELTGEVRMAQGSEQGMVLDYYKISEIVKREIMDKYDHQDLNVVMRPYFGVADPNEHNLTTAENMVVIFATILRTEINKLWNWKQGDETSIRLTRVRLSETGSSWADWYAEDN